MKKLKLEVGKTYRNRKGEEVTIVRKYDNDRPPYQGNNGNWYTESGKWNYFSKEDPEDLIEEVEEVPETCHAFITPDEAKKVTATRYTFAIPDGMTKLTVEQVSNRIIVEMVPEEKGPKPGDVMKNERGSVYILKEAGTGDMHRQFVLLGENGRLFSGAWCHPGRPATPEEAQRLFDALKKAGKRWNPHTMQVEELSESDRIREWVGMYAYEGFSNREVCYTLEDLAEVIEAYLKHREDAK